MTDWLLLALLTFAVCAAFAFARALDQIASGIRQTNINLAAIAEEIRQRFPR